MSEYYISPAGTDASSGTEARPLRTFEPFSSGKISLDAGDTVWLRGGTIPSRGVELRDAVGSPSHPIEIVPEGDAIPVLDVSSGNGHGVLLEQCGWIRIRGFEIRGAANDGIHVTGPTPGPITIEKMEVHGYARSGEGNGIHGREEIGELTVRGCLARENHPNGGVNCAGIRLGPGVRNGTILACESYRNSGSGITATATDSSESVVVGRSIAHRNGDQNAGGTDGVQRGIQLRGKGTIERCITYNNIGGGLRIQGSGHPVSIEHCTTWANAGPGYDVRGPSIRLRNNLAWNDTAGPLVTNSDVDDRWNSWTLSIDDPGIQSTDDTEKEFLQPYPDSGLVDAGVDLHHADTPRSPDVGARCATSTTGHPEHEQVPVRIGGRSPVLAHWRQMEDRY